MRIKEIQYIARNEEIVIGIKCDVCGKIHKGNCLPDNWHEFDHHHGEWGNDSPDSFKWHQVCSPECYFKKLKECVSNLKGRSDASIDEFEIQFARKLIKCV